MASPHRSAIAWGLSIAFHVEALIFGAGLLSGAERTPEATAAAPAAGTEIAVEVELPAAGPTLAALRAEESRPSGGETMPRPDGDRAGRAGEASVSTPAINLAPRDDEATSTRAITSGHEHSQQVRRRSGEGRRSPEDDTVAPGTMILTFFADGDGPEPRPHAPRETARLELGEAGRRGAERLVGPGVEPLDRPRRERLGRGQAATAPRARQASAPALPLAITGRPSTPADDAGRQEDVAEGAQQIADREPSLLAASTAGGEQGAGRGGEPGEGRSGSGGTVGQGSRSRAQGGGDGTGPGHDPGDLYKRRVWAKIQGSWSTDAFPREAVLEGRGGTTIVAFTVLGNGAVQGVRTIRPSGFPGFDAAMRAAVQRAAPFGPLPDSLGENEPFTHEFAVSNPAVR